MPYVTVRQSKPFHQLSFEDVFLGAEATQQYPEFKRDTSGTITRFIKFPKTSDIIHADIPQKIALLEMFNDRWDKLFHENRLTLYHTFYIPKHSGGVRKIDEPNPELMTALRELRTIFQDKMGALYHTAAFAYVEGRSTIDAIKRHQANQSRWFLKTDFSNFFGSTTEEFLFDSVSSIFPFSEIVKSTSGKQALSKALNLCFLNGGLPQGTPISPMLTNLMMIPMDHKIFNELTKRGFVYTRYADDTQISHKYDFSQQEMVAYINGVLKEFNAPFKIKDSKTRYGSSAGKNWNLGVMLNKDNEITVGYQRKKQFKAMVNNFIVDRIKGVVWPIEDVNHFNGLYRYYHMVEPEYFDHMISEYNKKYKCDFKIMLKAALSGR